MIRGRVPISVSVLIIWALTVISVILSLLALIGLLISRQDKIKRPFLEFLDRKFAVKIEDIDIKFFPLVQIWNVHAKGVSFGVGAKSLKLDSVKVENFKLVADGIYANVVGIQQVEFKLRLPNHIIIQLSGARIDISGSTGGDLNLNSVCTTLEVIREKIGKLLNVNIDFGSLGLYVKDFGIISDGNINVLSGKISLKSTLSLIFRDRKVTDGILTFRGNLKGSEGDGAFEIYNPRIRSGFHLVICQDNWFEVMASVSLTSDLEKIVEIGSNFSDILSEIVSEDKFKTFLSSTSWMKIVVDYAGYVRIDWNSRVELGQEKSESIEITGSYDSKMGSGDLKFSGTIDLSLIRYLRGYLKFSGSSQVPKFGGLLIGDIKNFRYDIINIGRGEAKISFKDYVAYFSLLIYVGEYPVRWRGEADLRRKSVRADFNLFEVSAKKILEALSVSMPIDGVTFGSGKFFLKDSINVSGYVDVRNANFLGEKIECVSLSVRTKVRFDGRFNIDLEGVGVDYEKEGACPSSGISLDGLSFVNFRAKIDDRGFKTYLQGVYDLQRFDMVDLGMVGVSEFLGSVSGNLKGKIYGEIDVSTQELSFVDYPIRSSCAKGKITFSQERLNFSGDTCENFQISATYLFDTNKFLAYVWSDDVMIFTNGSDIYGDGSIKGVQSVLPIYGDGVFRFAYGKRDRSGFVKVKSGYFIFEGIRFDDFDFASDIKRDVLDFALRASFKENPVELYGIYNMVTKRISAELFMKSFAGIPLGGKLSISGDLRAMSIFGEVTISNETFSDRRIRSVVSELQSFRTGESKGIFASASAEPTKGSPLNIVINLKNVVYDEPPLNLKLSGQIYIVGYVDSPKILGIFEIHDGTFLFAGMDFRKITGNVFMRNEEIIVNLSAQNSISTLDGESYLIKLNILGNLRAPNIYLSSIPSLPESDIVCVIAVLRKCRSADDFRKILGSVMYRNVRFLFSRIEEAMNLKEGTIRPTISPTSVGVAGEWGANEVEIVQSIIDEVVKFRLSHRLSDSISLQLTWDNKKYGFSGLGNMGNLGMDIKTIMRFW